MKIKFMLMAVVTMFAFSYSGQASIGVTTNFNKLNISIVVTTNATPVTVDNVTTWKASRAKLANKDLLTIFAGTNFANTIFPTGAQLVVGWDDPWQGDVLVVDKSGTNVLYDVNNS